MKYKVSFKGFAYVEADSDEDAIEAVLYEDDAVYKEIECVSVKEVDDFVINLED